jgi:hypothetical protein
MAKTIRFAELVKRSGKPESVTLWTKPKDNPSFMKAVRDNRVLTIIQTTVGTKTDFGEIGFHQKPSALYLIFPKRLPKTPDLRVVGIKYDLLEASAAQKSKESAAKRINRKPIAKPIAPKKFRVTVLRIATQEVKLDLEGANLHEAESRALEDLKTKAFAADDVQDEIKTIVEK